MLGSCYSGFVLALASWVIHKRSASPCPSQAALLVSSSLYERDWRAGVGRLPQSSGAWGLGGNYVGV